MGAMAITLAQAQANLDAWIDASRKLADGQVARVGDQRLDRADWPQVQKAINFWRGEVARLEADAAGKPDPAWAVASFGFFR